MNKILKGGLLAATLFGLGACGTAELDRNEFRDYVRAVMQDVQTREPHKVERYSEPQETAEFDFYKVGDKLIRRIRVVRDEHGTTVTIGSRSAGAASIRNGACVEVPNGNYNGGCPHLSAKEARDIFDRVVAFDKAQAEKS